MKVAVFGRGKTGSEVSNKLSDQDLVGPFGSDFSYSIDDLKGAKTAIVFVPGNAIERLIEFFVENKVNVIWGSTGHTWPQGLDLKLTDAKLKWIHGSNFSLAMTIVKTMIEDLSKIKHLLPDIEFNLHEVHHTKKLDAPSGTALSWKSWMGDEASNLNITHERIGDTIGIHEITAKHSNEQIILKHQSLNRGLFAQGAIWAAEQLETQDLKYGITLFEDLTKKAIENAKS
jgi:4-hydroxy-tetrahydrodipicolinate reductase